ncbi:MAG: NAD(P)/FAD-dependent oxidoreductase, partial [Roseibacillus sp.]
MTQSPETFDIIVIGGGPSGSTAAALLAEKGRSVVVLEKEKFPRYHVGESLMPFCYFTLQRLGVLDEMEKHSFVKKHSVQFVTKDGRVSAPFYFFQHLDHPAATTWQVERSVFDEMLLRNAEAKGAEVREETMVRKFLYDGKTVTGVLARGSDGIEYPVEAPLTLDCTGRDALYQRKKSTRKRDPMLNKISIW